ncbi:MAG TPA: ABC transporter permease, partial [Vicinamibacterales bacterium]|nr:ABC transporter permease [Vicinamibacterales bacterium]
MTLLRRIWHLINRSRNERELVREMSAHRDSMHDPSKFGDTHRLLEYSRDAWGWNWLDDAMQDLTVGVRTLAKAPSFAITAMLILTFGIGLNLTLFQLISIGMLRPPAVRDAASWVRFIRAAPNSNTSTVPYPLTQFVKDHNNGVLASVVVEYQSALAWGRDAEEQVNASFVSSNWFEEMGYGAAQGRVLNEALDARADAPVVVLSFAYWRNRLGSDPNVVGTVAYIDRKPVTIAGVAAAALPGLDFNVPDMFLSITQREYFYPQSTLLRSWSDEAVDMYGRLAPGVSGAAAREALRTTMQAAAAEHAQVKHDEWLEPLLATQNFMRDSERQAVLAVVSLIGALTTLVLVVAAANLGNLVMSRATGRVRELGVRMALGARRTRIVRQLVIESVPLVAMGAVGSLGFAWAAATAIAALGSFPPYMDFSIRWATVVAAVTLALIALVVVGLLPAWKIAQQHLIDAVKDGGQNVSRTLDRTLLRRIMVVSQVAGSCLLLIIAGMMIRSVQRAIASSAGFDYEHAAVLSMPLGRYGMPVDARRSYWYQVKERVLANPEVEAAAVVTAAPLGGRVNETHFNATPGLRTLSQSVDAEYFATMQIPLLSGRLFNANEPDVVIISRRLALEMYGTLDVLGKAFPVTPGGPSRSSGDVPKLSAPQGTIVGVAADAHSIKVDANDVAELYRPLKVEDFAYVEMVARARRDAQRLLPILREAAMMDPRVIPAARAMHEDFQSRMQAPRIASGLSAAIGLLTLGLACLGIFGVVSYGVALRTKEIGIRVALGAPQPALLRSIVRQVLTPVAVGV